MYHGPLKFSYSGTYEVFEGGNKIYKILVKGKGVKVSIDHLKLAHTLVDPSTNTLPLPTPTNYDI